MARGNLQVWFSSGGFLGRLYVQNFNQPKLIPAIAAAEFYCIHALAYEVQPQAPWLHIFERAPAHFFWVHCRAAIFQYDFKLIFGLAISSQMNPPDGCLDGLIEISEVAMSYDLSQHFIDCPIAY